MANALNGMTFTNIARLGLGYLTKALAPIKAMSTDLSGDAVAQGTVVSTRLFGAATTAVTLASLSGDYSASIPDQTTTAVSCTIGSPVLARFAFTEQEMAAIEAGVMTDSIDKLVQSHAYELARYVLNSAYNLVTSANYSTAGLVKASASVDADDLGALRTACVKAGWNMLNASAVLNPDLYGAVANSNDVTDKTNVLIDGVVPKVRGFALYEDAIIDACTPASGENLTGFVSTPAAIALAIRSTKALPGNDFVYDQTVVDEKSGLPLRYTVRYNGNYRRLEHCFEIAYGVAKGDPAALKRITSA